MHIPLWQSLPPHLVFSRGVAGEIFPFDQKRCHAFYYARIGIFHLARKLVELGYRKALFPAYHHGTEVTALEAGGMQLIFYNVHRDGKADLEDLEGKVAQGDGVLFVSHYNGFPQEMGEILEIKRKHDLILIEDTALSLLSRWRGRFLGQFGEVGIFCPYKTYPLPNGGVLVVNDERFDLDVKVRPPGRLSTNAHLGRMMLNWVDLKAHGLGQKVLRLRPAIKRLLRGVKSEPVPIGDSYFNPKILDWGMSRISHRILRHCNPEQVARKRRANYAYLLKRISPTSEARPLYPGIEGEVVPLFFPLLVEKREEVYAHLQSNGVECSCFWKPWLPHVDSRNFPEVDFLRRSVLELPCHQDLNEKELDYVVAALERAIAALRR